MRPTKRIATRAGLAVGLLVALSGCGGSTTTTPTTVIAPPTPPTTPPPFAVDTVDEVAPSTVPSTITAPTATSSVTSPTGQADESATPPTVPGARPVTAPAITVPPATTVVSPPGEPPSTFVAMDGADLVTRDPVTGEVLDVLVADFADAGAFPGAFNLTPDRTRLYFSEFVEDGWFDCELSRGVIAVADLEAGVTSTVAVGSSPALSPDGTRLAFLGSSLCLDDPDTDGWMITPYDRVVVLDLASGERIEHTTAAPPAGYGDPAAFEWVGWDDDDHLLVMTAPGQVHRVAASSPGVVQDDPPILSLDQVYPLGVHGGEIIGIFYTADFADVVAVDVRTGEQRLLATSSVAPMVGIDPDGRILMSTGDRLVPAPTVIAVDPPITLVAFDQLLGSIDW